MTTAYIYAENYALGVNAGIKTQREHQLDAIVIVTPNTWIDLLHFTWEEGDISVNACVDVSYNRGWMIFVRENFQRHLLCEAAFELFESCLNRNYTTRDVSQPDKTGRAYFNTYNQRVEYV